jgi:hypothetical protein
VLLLKLFKGEVGCGLIIAHIVVPSLREFKELGFLCRLYILKFLLLSCPNVILLSNGFFSEELIELTSSFFGLLVVTLYLALLSVLLK